MSAPGPVSLSPPPPVLPEVTVPEVRLPRVPEIPIPGVPEPEQRPEPAPMPPPFTPQPNPNVPQPPLIPVPQPVPVPVPAPQPQPRRRPQPAPMPQPAPAPTPAPTPAEPGTSKLVRRSLREHEITAGKAKCTFMTIVAGITGLITTVQLLHTDPSYFSFFTLLFTGGLLALTIFFIRQAIYTGAIHHARIAQPAEARLGGSLPLEVTIGVLRDLPITSAMLTVTAEERVVVGEGKSQTTQRHTLFSRELHFITPAQWPGGKEVSFTKHVPLPDNAVPSFSGRHCHIEWQAALHVDIPAWYPDIRVRTLLKVPPIALTPPPPATAHRLDLPALDDLRATLTLMCARDEYHRPLLVAGDSVPFTLTIHPEQEVSNQRVQLELTRTVKGEGQTEHLTVARESCFEGGWAAGEAAKVSGVLAIPPDAPLTYRGKLIAIDWALTVRRAIPWSPDRRQVMEVVVIPAGAPAGEEAPGENIR